MPLDYDNLSDNEITTILADYDANNDAPEGSEQREIYHLARIDLYLIDDPKIKLRVIDIASRINLKKWSYVRLGAGLLEDLLTYHGEKVIVDLETIAEINENVRFMLTCVWYYGVDDGLYKRIRNIVDEKGPPQQEFWREPNAESRSEVLRTIAEYYSS